MCVRVLILIGKTLCSNAKLAEVLGGSGFRCCIYRATARKQSAIYMCVCVCLCVCVCVARPGSPSMFLGATGAFRFSDVVLVNILYTLW